MRSLLEVIKGLSFKKFSSIYRISRRSSLTKLSKFALNLFKRNKAAASKPRN